MTGTMKTCISETHFGFDCIMVIGNTYFMSEDYLNQQLLNQCHPSKNFVTTQKLFENDLDKSKKNP